MLNCLSSFGTQPVEGESHGWKFKFVHDIPPFIGVLILTIKPVPLHNVSLCRTAAAIRTAAMTCLQALLRGRLLTVEQLDQLLTDLLPKVSSVLVLPQATLHHTPHWLRCKSISLQSKGDCYHSLRSLYLYWQCAQ